MSNSAHEAGVKKFQKFFLSEILISAALINGILNAVIYYFTTHSTQSIGAFSMNVLFTMGILSAILLPLYPVLAKKKLKKIQGITIPYSRKNHMLAVCYPSGKLGRFIISFLLCVVVSTPLCLGLAGSFGLVEVTRLQGAIIKGIGTGFCSGLANYLALLFFCIDYHIDDTLPVEAEVVGLHNA